MEVQGDRPGLCRRPRPARPLARRQRLSGSPATIVDLPTGTLAVSVDEAAWPLDDLCAFAARRNPKRGFLVVSKVLGRHWPAAPATMRAAIRDLAARLPADLPGPIVVVGLAETAVGLGQTLHAELGRADALYFHSTRQQVEGTLLGRFEEPHSHASAHLLYEPVVAGFDAPRSLVLVDDEVSTGTTLANLARVLVARWPTVERIGIATLADWSGGAWLATLPRPAERAYLLAGSLDWQQGEAAEPLSAPAGSLGRLGCHRNRGRLGMAETEVDLPFIRHPGLDPGSRFLPPPERSGTPDQVRGDAEWVLPALATGTPLRIIGTGEFTYAPFRLAEAMAAAGHDVVVQATSRSPVRIGGAIRHALVFEDDYGTGVPNHLYNADPADGRTNWVCHETPSVDPKLLESLNATAIRWPA